MKLPGKVELIVTTQTVTLQLPESIYERVQRTAQMLQRPVEEFLLDTVTTALPLLDDLPPELVEDMAALALLNDKALWRVAQSTLSKAAQKRLDWLLDQQGRRELAPAEQQELDQLLHEYERVVLTRAQAAVLLKQRGYDLSDPTVFNKPLEIP